MVMRPVEVLDHRSSLWEEILDSTLREHRWWTTDICKISIPTQDLYGMEVLLDRYREVGWGVVTLVQDDAIVITFTPPHPLKEQKPHAQIAGQD